MSSLETIADPPLAIRLRQVRGERQRAVHRHLLDHPGWSDRRIARELGVNRDLVARTRETLEWNEEIPKAASRVGADGKSYTRLPKERPTPERDPVEQLGRKIEGLAAWAETEHFAEFFEAASDETRELFRLSTQRLRRRANELALRHAWGGVAGDSNGSL